MLLYNTIFIFLLQIITTNIFHILLWVQYFQRIIVSQNYLWKFYRSIGKFVCNIKCLNIRYKKRCLITPSNTAVPVMESCAVQQHWLMYPKLTADKFGIEFNLKSYKHEFFNLVVTQHIPWKKWGDKILYTV